MVRFEIQFAAIKERLEAAKAGSTNGLGSGAGQGAGGQGAFSFSSAGSRIAKPLRGGGGGGPAIVPTISSLQHESPAGGNGSKRTSWFFTKG